jgi:hypothetical protein
VIASSVRGYLSRLHERPWLEHRRIVTGRLHLLAGWGKHGSIAADLKPWDPSCSDPVTHTPIYQQALFPTPRAGKIGRKQVPGALGFEGEREGDRGGTGRERDTLLPPSNLSQAIATGARVSLPSPLISSAARPPFSCRHIRLLTYPSVVSSTSSDRLSPPPLLMPADAEQGVYTPPNTPLVSLVRARGVAYLPLPLCWSKLNANVERSEGLASGQRKGSVHTKHGNAGGMRKGNHKTTLLPEGGMAGSAWADKPRVRPQGGREEGRQVRHGDVVHVLISHGTADSIKVSSSFALF